MDNGKRCAQMEHHSVAQQSFMREQRRQNSLVLFYRLFFFLLFLFIWEFCARFDIIDDFIFASPSRVLRCFFTMLADKSLFTHISITLLETIASFLLVIAVSLLLAILLWFGKKAAKVAEPYLVVLNSLPKSALAPLLIVWLGANYKTIIVTGMSVAIFGSILSLYAGFREVNPEKIKLIHTLGGGRSQALRKAVLPSSLPVIVNTMKVNIGLCLVGVVIGEFIGARKGLGYLIIYGTQTFLRVGEMIQQFSQRREQVENRACTSFPPALFSEGTPT